MPDYIYWTSYLIIINLAAAAAVVLDKHRAKRHLWRVPESRLLLLSALGGSPAMLLTMLLIRHKTKHAKFMVGIPAIMTVQGFLLYVGFRFLK
ncbi:DUF1294 domain-containing protein [Caproiciproducens sp. NJN-50]|uniref:DUF1294 domain-containing protein n=1 Tax=Acutalibacteraceae TaxID=3082771 RepID=UPI000FFE11F8|nr:MULTISPECIES: DUF1294 domain-containing protein [Acutalibacteraceae]QAT49759.1 DUF1294 domain-containing protein [Caproiciproducens sp. NJN-50]